MRFHPSIELLEGRVDPIVAPRFREDHPGRIAAIGAPILSARG